MKKFFEHGPIALEFLRDAIEYNETDVINMHDLRDGSYMNLMFWIPEVSFKKRKKN